MTSLSLHVLHCESMAWPDGFNKCMHYCSWFCIPVMTVYIYTQSTLEMEIYPHKKHIQDGMWNGTYMHSLTCKHTCSDIILQTALHVSLSFIADEAASVCTVCICVSVCWNEITHCIFLFFALKAGQQHISFRPLKVDTLRTSHVYSDWQCY